jgi:hypothetical protein
LRESSELGTLWVFGFLGFVDKRERHLRFARTGVYFPTVLSRNDQPCLHRPGWLLWLSIGPFADPVACGEFFCDWSLTNPKAMVGCAMNDTLKERVKLLCDNQLISVHGMRRT